MKQIISNKSNLNVSNNEFSLNHTVQRAIDKLFTNDTLLQAFYQEILGGYQIYEWKSSNEYEYNQIVWWTYKKGVDEKAKLFILRCNKTKIEAGSLLKYPGTSLEDLGWTDLNPDIDIINQYGLGKKIGLFFQKLIKQHSESDSLHRFGKISYTKSGITNIDQKVAKRDLSNINSERENIFFPYKTVYLNHDNSVQNGYLRWYDNGLMEYDILFKLGYSGNELTDSEYNIYSDIISCNNLEITDGHDSDKYFNSGTDMEIFNVQNSESNYESQIGGTVQRHRNDYVNVYSATINFSSLAYPSAPSRYAFKDTNYMIFSSDVMCQDRDTSKKSMNISPNSMIFCQKTTKSFTAILITYPNMKNFSNAGYNAQNGGLMQDVFHCHIIGRGK